MPAALPWLLAALLLAGWIVSIDRYTRRLTRALVAAARAGRQLAGLQARIEALETELERERAILDRLPDPLILFGADRSVQRLNAVARSALAPGMPALLRHPSFRTALERAQTERQDQFAELSLPVPTARDLHASVLVLPSDGQPLAAVLSDRTHDRALERMRSDFVANASHELRTPLASLIGFIDTLRGPAADDPAAQTRFLGIMADQAQRMNRLIDGLLSLSRIEMTEHLPPSGRVAVASLLDRVAASMAPQVTTRRITLEKHVTPDLPDVPADEDQLEQVLQNLMDNAVKYGTEGGTVRVSAGRATQLQAEGVLIAVHDDGPGIPREHLPRLTERFYRVDTHRSRAVGGTGLGLAIVKHIVNRHRGQLMIESKEGAGTTVQIWLPT